MTTTCHYCEAPANARCRVCEQAACGWHRAMFGGLCCVCAVTDVFRPSLERAFTALRAAGTPPNPETVRQAFGVGEEAHGG